MAHERLKRDLREQFWMRLHMALILLTCVLAGFIANRMLFWLGVHSLPWRYLWSTVVGYAAFFGGVRLWLWYVGAHVDAATAKERRQELAQDGADIVDIGVDVVDAAGQSASGLSDVGDLVSGAADGEGCLLLSIGIVAVLALLALGGGALWLMYEAPMLLAEVAVQAMLAAGLLRASRRLDAPGWAGSVWRQTGWAFAACLLAVVLLGAAIQHMYPDAKTLGDAIAQHAAAKQR